MKILALSISLLFCTFVCNAQFVLTPDGLVSANDASKYYVVYEFKGLMQNYLYSRILPFAKEHFIHPEDYITEREPEQVIVGGIGINKIGTGAIKGDIVFTLSIRMEDGKLGYEVEELSFSNAVLVESEDSRKDYIFDKEGRVHNKDLKDQVEGYFNFIVNETNSYIKNTANVDWL
ncbi:MAG: hypothetical protein LBV72_14345 [Tannerella sp.]|jgi:hypothetical protein|nr:hypothetical protein [Tannerella sp.]